MKDHPSITRLVNQLRAPGKPERDAAAVAIWQAYFPRLLALARERLAPRIRARTDEEDVLQSMYKSFCLRYQRGEFSLADRDELWRLLVHMTLCKVRKAATHHGREKRAVKREQRAASPYEGSLAQMTASAPTPDEVVALEEAMLRWLEALPDDLRRVALWKLEGYTNAEIAGPTMLDCAERTVERKLALIRQHWERVIADAERP